MLVCYVIEGDSICVKFDGSSTRNFTKPPMKNNNMMYDSVKNDDKSHTIIYDYNKHYPAYVITFKTGQ